VRNKLSIHSMLVLVLLLFACASLDSPALAQSADREKPKLKDFGSSLKRIKWDAKQNAAVETKRKDEKGNGEKGDSDIDVVRVETALVAGDFLVLDERGLPVKGLTRDDFVVKEDGKAHQVGSFSLGDDVAIPRSIVLIIDYSGSQAPFIETSVEAAKVLVDKLGPQDRMAIVTDDVELLVNFTRDKEKLKNSLELLKERVPSSSASAPSAIPFQERRYGRSAQFSALMATLKEAFDDEDQRPIIIFQTDGDELIYLRQPIISPTVPVGLPPDMRKMIEERMKQSLQEQRNKVREFSLEDVYKAAQKSRATIYTVIPGGIRLMGFTPDQQVERIKAFEEKVSLEIRSPQIRARRLDNLKRTLTEAFRLEAQTMLKVQSALAVLSTITGGWIEFLEDRSQASEIYSHIFLDINRRYVVGYYPINKEHDGKRRKIDIEVKGHPEYLVVGRKSYYAPGPED